MANLAEAIQGLVAHMRKEQEMIREWADGQGEQNREIKKVAGSVRQAVREELNGTFRVPYALVETTPWPLARAMP